MTTTLYGILLSATGLSHKEASALHGVRLDTVTSWVGGRRNANDGVVRELALLLGYVQITVDVIYDNANTSQGSTLIKLAAPDIFPMSAVYNRKVAIAAAKLIREGIKVELV